jgi:hypothetical protein
MQRLNITAEGEGSTDTSATGKEAANA